MKTTLILLFLIFAFLAILIVPHLLKEGAYVIIDSKKFYVDVAKTQQEKEKGLAIYKSMPKDRGMIFPFNTLDYRYFWMKGMAFPLDIIYIRQGKIVEIFKSLPPPKSAEEILPTVTSEEKTDMVLETNAGLSNQYNFKKGDLVKVNY